MKGNYYSIAHTWLTLSVHLFSRVIISTAMTISATRGRNWLRGHLFYWTMLWHIHWRVPYSSSRISRFEHDWVSLAPAPPPPDEPEVIEVSRNPRTKCGIFEACTLISINKLRNPKEEDRVNRDNNSPVDFYRILFLLFHGTRNNRNSLHRKSAQRSWYFASKYSSSKLCNWVSSTLLKVF